MSSAYDHYSTHDQNPNCTIPQQNQEEDDTPFSLNLLPSPFLDDNQLFLDHMMFPYHQNHHQQLMLADDDQINQERDSRYTVINKHNINTVNTTEEISKLTARTTAVTHHVPKSSSSEVAEKGKASTDNDTNHKKKVPCTSQRKRGKKDRHSKICTAQGLRDRRMRLSLQIARKFFDLQDILGFDKASKTIDWLFSKSKKAIKKLSCNANHLGQMNHTINVPNNFLYSQVETDEMMRKALTTTSDSVSFEGKTGGKYKHNNAKELREKARARARERTREKMMMRCLENAKQNHVLNLHQTSRGDGYNLRLGYAGGNPNSVAFEEEAEELMSMSSCPSQDHTAVDVRHYKDLNSHHSSSLGHQLASVGILDNFLATCIPTSSAASCSIFDYPINDDALLLSGKNPKPIFMENSCYHHFQTEKYPTTNSFRDHEG